MTDADVDANLRKLASRLAQLARLPRLGRQDLGLISLAVGAVYAIRRAVDFGYSGSWDRRTQKGHVRKAAEALEQVEIRETTVYRAGYYFNDSIIRLDIAYEGFLRATTDQRDIRAKELIDLAETEKGIDRGKFHEWREIRCEVNALKHRNPEQIALHSRGGGVSVPTIVSALTKLVTLIENRVPKRG